MTCSWPSARARRRCASASCSSSVRRATRRPSRSSRRTRSTQAMRIEPAFSGSELNVEGAALAGDDVLFLQRGNGAAARDRHPVDASARIDRARSSRYLRGLARGETLRVLRSATSRSGTSARARRHAAHVHRRRGDAGPMDSVPRVRRSLPDATRDGPVAGVAIGRLDDRSGESSSARSSTSTTRPSSTRPRASPSTTPTRAARGS